MQEVSGIYMIKNSINNKVYIGQTRYSIIKRINNHIKYLRKNCHKNKHLQNSWNKYGESAFITEILKHSCDIINLDNFEIYWINFYKSYDQKFGYNKTYGGHNGLLTEEVLKKLSEINTGKKLSQETKNKIGSFFKGRKHSEETIEKMKNVQSGKKLTEAHKKKLSEVNTGKKHSEESKIKMSKVFKEIQYNRRKGENHPEYIVITEDMINLFNTSISRKEFMNTYNRTIWDKIRKNIK
jgi:group I intron endonuclease